MNEHIVLVGDDPLLRRSLAFNLERAGCRASTDVPQEVYDLMALYPQAAQRRPSVQYVPVPYRREERRPNLAGLAGVRHDGQ